MKLNLCKCDLCGKTYEEQSMVTCNIDRFNKLNGSLIENIHFEDLCKDCFSQISNCITFIHEDNNGNPWRISREL